MDPEEAPTEQVVRARAARFALRWEGRTGGEMSESHTFMNEFFRIFGINRVDEGIVFEERLGTSNERMDCLWSGKLLIEMKSRHKNLDVAMKQALNYYSMLSQEKQPRYLLACNFHEWFFVDKKMNRLSTFTLQDLEDNIGLFGFMTGGISSPRQHPVDMEAVDKIKCIYDGIDKERYPGVDTFLTRLVYCYFADNTGIFGRAHMFQQYLLERTTEDGSDMGIALTRLFDALNLEKGSRKIDTDGGTDAFRYINGPVFKTPIVMPEFDEEMRALMIEAGEADWSKVSPTIFGSMFQMVLKNKERQNLGAYYTSEDNIIRVLRPLLLDDLDAELNELRRDASESRVDGFRRFQDKLASLKFLDPACGSGNFLVVAYREIRRLEHQAIMQIYGDEISEGAVGDLSKVNVDQFYGIEVEPKPVRIAEISMWMMDHLMNLELGRIYGIDCDRIPLRKRPKIVHGDALEMDWDDVVPRSECRYVLGNPPYGGQSVMDGTKKEQTREITGSGALDYVSNWFVKGAEYARNADVRIAFVATNSVTQGEHIPMWDGVLAGGLEISFAYQSFKWESESAKNAKVMVVIVGLGRNPSRRRLFVADGAEWAETNPERITPYLRPGDGKAVDVRETAAPLNGLPPILLGSVPKEGGHYIFTGPGRSEFLEQEPGAGEYMAPYYAAKDMLHGRERYILKPWTILPHELRTMPKVLERVGRVRDFRRHARSPEMHKYADRPLEFLRTRIPKLDYLAIPRVSSAGRMYVPMRFMKVPVIMSDAAYQIEGATVQLFGLLESRMHTVWIRQTSGRLKEDFRYSANMTYNTFPVPGDYSSLEGPAQGVLDTRARYPESTLADLYDPLAMPPDLRGAHGRLDRAVDRLYRREPFGSDEERFEHLLEMYRVMAGVQEKLSQE